MAKLVLSMAAASCVGAGAFLLPSVQPTTDLARTSTKRLASVPSGSTYEQNEFSMTRVLAAQCRQALHSQPFELVYGVRSYLHNAVMLPSTDALMEMVPSRFYDLLGVKPEASPEEIRRAYRRLALKLHPDRGGDSRAFQELSNAYEVLSNSERRAVYDRFGEEATNIFCKAWDILCTRSSQGLQDTLSPTHGQDIFDILRSQGGGLFADLFGFGRLNQPIQVRISVTLEEAYLGTSQQLRIRRLSCSSCQGRGASVLCASCEGSGVSIHRRAGPGFVHQVQVTCPHCRGRGFVGQPCSQCHGSGTREEQQEVSVAVPAGVENGHELPCHFVDGRRCNDVVCMVKVKRHMRFERLGDDLHSAVEVSLSDALLGVIRQVGSRISWIEGHFKLHQLDRLQHLDGRCITLRPKKVLKPDIMSCCPEVNSHERGDLHLHLQVTFPDELDERTAKELLADLQRHLNETRGLEAKSRLSLVLGGLLAAAACRRQARMPRPVTKTQIHDLTLEDLPEMWRPSISISMSRRSNQMKGIRRQLEKTFFLMAFNKEHMASREIEEARALFPPTCKVRVLKNSLVRKAMEGSEWEQLGPYLVGSNMYVFVESDRDLKPAIQAYIKMEKTFDRTATLDAIKEDRGDDLTYDLNPLVGGIMSEEWNVLTAEDVMKLKDLQDFPTKTELIGQIAGSIKQVTQKLAVGIKQVPTKLAIGIKATVEKGEEEGKSTVGDVA
eukprot:symbB.v1.2.033713.t4/scaffold4175.1/size43496/3